MASLPLPCCAQESTNGKTGDAWMVQVEPLAARKAYMFCAGK